MSKKNLIYFCSTFNTSHTIKQYGLDNKNNKIAICAISLLPLNDRKVYFNFYRNREKVLIKKKNFKFIFNLKELLKLILNLKGEIFFINNTKLSFSSILVENFLVIFKKAKKIDLTSGYHQFEIIVSKKLVKLYKKEKIFVLRKIYEYIKANIVEKFLNFFSRKPILFFTDNSKIYRNLKKNSNNVIKYDNENYSKFLELKNKKKTKNKYITFLDMNFDNNFDFAIGRKKSSKFDTKQYWKRVDSFLNKIQAQFRNYKVIIAAHPKRDLGEYPIEKKFVHYKTAELVKNSKFVITHYSTSTILPVLFEKPILLLDDSSFDFHSFIRRSHIDFLSENLSIKKINLSNYEKLEKNSISKYLKVNKIKYKNFFENYYGFQKGKSFKKKWIKILSHLQKMSK
jgi:hypothetical protein